MLAIEPERGRRVCATAVMLPTHYLGDAAMAVERQRGHRERATMPTLAVHLNGDEIVKHVTLTCPPDAVVDNTTIAVTVAENWIAEALVSGERHRPRARARRVPLRHRRRRARNLRAHHRRPQR